MLETLQEADQNLLLFLNGLHTPFWDSFMAIYTAKLTWAPMYAAILYVLCKNFRPVTCLLTVIAIVLTITYADQMCATFIRPLVERMRPSNLNNPISEFVHIVNGKRGGKYGFPSCHAANSFALAFFMVLFFKNKILSTFILLWAALNSYSRIYTGVHYPGDLLAGLVVGLSGALLIYFLYRYLLNRPQIETLLKISLKDKDRLSGRFPVIHLYSIIYVGLTTIFLFSVYSAWKTW